MIKVNKDIWGYHLETFGRCFLCEDIISDSSGFSPPVLCGFNMHYGGEVRIGLSSCSPVAPLSVESCISSVC